MNIRKEVLKSQENLKIINITNNEVITKAKFGPSKEIRIPFLLNNLLSFFTATIIGDGHLKKSKQRTSIELSNIELIKYIQKVCKELFNREFKIHSVKPREGRKQTYYIAMDSKAIHSLLNKVFEIQIGKKSNIVYIPSLIKKSSDSIKSSFLMGIMFTEGGNRRRGYGLSTSSKKLWEDLTKMFNELGIKVFLDKWIYKKYNKEYYGLYFKKDKIKILLEKCKNKELKDFFEKTFNY